MNLRKVDTLQQLNEKLTRYLGGHGGKAEEVPLEKAVGRVLSEDVIADTDMPPFTRSTVDGYGVRAADTFGVSEGVPGFLNLRGQAPMGALTELSLSPGEAVYVPTGAMLPIGADSAIMIEHTEAFGDDMVAVYKPAAPGNNLFKRGEDFTAGTTVLDKGHRIGVKDVGILACLGKSRIKVYEKPKVGLISTGDELVRVGETPLPGQIRDVNAPVIAAFLNRLGAQITGMELIKDDFNDLCRTASHMLEESDVLLISGGSSQGNKDMTESVIASLGEPGVFTHGLALKPGKPAIFGAVCRREDAKLIAGLPGHPMSAIVVYLAVIEPFLCRHFFDCSPLADANKVFAQMSENIHAGEGRETWQPVTLEHLPSGQVLAVPLYGKSGSIYQLSQTQGFVRIPVMSEGIKAGETVQVDILPL